MHCRRFFFLPVTYPGHRPEFPVWFGDGDPVKTVGHKHKGTHRFSLCQHHLVGARANLLDVVGDRSRNSQAPALPDRVMEDAFVPAEEASLFIHEIACRGTAPCVSLDKIGVSPVRDKADILAVPFPGIYEAVALRQFPDLGLGILAKRKRNVLQLFLGQHV